MITLELGSERSCFDTPAGEVTLALGTKALRARWLPGDPPTAAGLEAAIEAVEDAVMPLHGRWPPDALLQVRASSDSLRTLAVLAGTATDRDGLEALFSRATAVVMGRPVAHDPELAQGEVVAALVILREVLHHLGFERLRFLPA